LAKGRGGLPRPSERSEQLEPLVSGKYIAVISELYAI